MVGGSIESWAWSSNVTSGWRLIYVFTGYGDQLVCGVEGQAWSGTTVGLRLADSQGVVLPFEQAFILSTEDSFGGLEQSWIVDDAGWPCEGGAGQHGNTG